MFVFPLTRFSWVAFAAGDLLQRESRVAQNIVEVSERPITERVLGPVSILLF